VGSEMCIRDSRLVEQEPELAHAIFSYLPGKEAYRVSIRAPLTRPGKADILARNFAGGGGRGNAAGINGLPKSELSRFFYLFEEIFGS